MSHRTITAILALLSVAVFIYQYIHLENSLSVDNTSFVSNTLESGKYHIVQNQPVVLLEEPDEGIQPVLTQIRGSSKNIDLVMYDLEDKDVEDALIAAKNRGDAVRVLLNNGLYGKGAKANQYAYTYLESHNVPVHWSPSYFALTHQKTLITDNSIALIMTFNLTPKYYSTSRDFAIKDQDVADIGAIEAAFNSDWLADVSTKKSATDGDDLVWSPGSKQTLIDMINGSHSSLLIYNEEMQDQDIISSLEEAAERGVHIQILLTDSNQWHAAFSGLTQSGAGVRTFDPKAPLYIHSKMILSDGNQVFLGSENFSSASLNNNRELGILVSNPTVLAQLQTIFAKDWQSANPYISE